MNACVLLLRMKPKLALKEQRKKIDLIQEK